MPELQDVLHSDCLNAGNKQIMLLLRWQGLSTLAHLSNTACTTTVRRLPALQVAGLPLYTARGCVILLEHKLAVHGTVCALDRPERGTTA
jgi:hypothetical protein